MIVPILPTILLESLDIPQPYIVGITTNDYFNYVEEHMTTEERDSKTWVLLDPSYQLNRTQVEIDSLGAKFLWGCNSNLSTSLKSK